MEQAKKIVAVVVTYNRKELLKECLQTLKAQAYENLQVLVVDNASTDGTNEYIANLIDGQKVIYFNTGENLGGAGGFNLGMKKALQLGCDYIWLMDDDCIVQKDTLNAFLNFAKEKNDDFGFLSSVVKWTDGSICKMNVQRRGVYKKVVDFSNDQKIVLASFVSLFIKAETVEDVGLPIKDFFIWGDDWEYTYRISKKHDSYLVANSIVLHKCKQNFGVDISEESSERLNRYFYYYRNEGYFYRKNGFGWYFFLKKLLHIKRILFSRCTEKVKRLKILKQGVKAARKFNPKIEYSFRANKSLEVLEIFSNPFFYGGEEAFVINMYQNFHGKNHYTFFTPFAFDNTNLLKQTQEKGDKIIYKNYSFNSKLNKLFMVKATKKLLKENRFDVIHIHSGSIFALCMIAKIAKKNGIKKVIAHSHGSGLPCFKSWLIKHYSDKRIQKYVDTFLACSDVAAEIKFPKCILDNRNYRIIKNGIATKKFVFDNNIRKEYRKEFGLTDEFVLCHVGRLDPEKNHNFIIKLAEILAQKKFNYKVILVGQGTLKDKIIKNIKDLGLSEKFILLEKRNDISQIMMASDLFLFPSLFEGLGIVAIEAQAAGLPVICSTNVPLETKLTDLINYVDLEKTEEWIKLILNYKNKVTNRSQYAEQIKNAGYDAKSSAELLENIYRGVNK